jgi:hypothetical protein
LTVETLEDRRLMTGDVIAKVAAGSLIVTGDPLSNNIYVRQTASGTFKVWGVKETHTTVNGSATTKSFSGVTGDVRINLGEGVNVVYIGGLASNPGVLPGKLVVTTGDGNDRVYLTNLRNKNADARIYVSTNGGNDLVDMQDCNFPGIVTLGMATGADRLNIRYSTVGKLRVDMGRDDDRVNLRHSEFTRGAYLDGGLGTNLLNTIDIEGKLTLKNFGQPIIHLDRDL